MNVVNGQGDAVVGKGAAGGGGVDALWLFETLERVRGEMVAAGGVGADGAGGAGGAGDAGAVNLRHYLALRRHDLRGLHAPLAELGLSSLGRAEAHALHNVESVMAWLALRLGRAFVPTVGGAAGAGGAGGAVTLERARRALAGAAAELLGGGGVDDDAGGAMPARIMVTMPSEAAEDAGVCARLLAAGMDLVRINCAHDDAEAWARMIRHVRLAERASTEKAGAGKGRVKVMMDLCGPKIRTGPMPEGPAVESWSVPRSMTGQPLRPVLLWIVESTGQAGQGGSESAAEPGPPHEVDRVLRIPVGGLEGVREGDQLVVCDARGKHVTVRLERVIGGQGGGGAGGLRGAVGVCHRSAWIVSASRFRIFGPRGRDGRRARVTGLMPFVGLPVRGLTILLKPGERLFLTGPEVPGAAEVRDRLGRVIDEGRIGCTAPEVFAHLRAGQSVWLDDGKIGCVVESASEAGAVLVVRNAKPEGVRLGPDKGINLPETELPIAALTATDREALGFVARHADIVGCSFVRSAADVREVFAALEAVGRPGMAVVLKIETKSGFERLPEILLAACERRAAGGGRGGEAGGEAGAVGVMIARGDLAVECGWERLAEIQEEMLWLCEAAHVPVIWATQVLERLAKKGLATRAEITDAAMAQRADCVMLNKGPYAERAVRTLRDILRRMGGHQWRKSPILRPLGVARGFGAGGVAGSAGGGA